jgi:hypothetical protein
MKKTISIFVLGLCVLGIMQTANAQYQKGDKLVNLGIGLGTYGAGGIGFGGSFEYGIHDAISVGAIAGYSGSSYGFSTTTFGARGSYHFNELLKLGNDKIDLYAGAGLAYRSFNWGSAGSILGSSYGSGIFPLFHLGGRYYFTNNLAGYAELGSGFGLAQVGVSFKF